MNERKSERLVKRLNNHPKLRERVEALLMDFAYFRFLFLQV